MGGNIDCHLDISSFYSYMCLVYLLKNREILKSHDVSVNFIPVFLGGINHGSGNKPPWTLPAKAAYGKLDSERAKKYFGLEHIQTPSFFPPVTLLPQRALCYVKANFSEEVFEKAWLELYNKMWTPPNVDITVPESLHAVLTGTKLFSGEEVDNILNSATEKQWKDALMANTQKVLGQGAFGAPWMWVKNGEGKEEPFFGSDRFHFIWEFLGLPWKNIAISPKGDEKPRL